ncbi:MAG: hypothetical protein P0Y59_20370 [Candidatus Sphingomonas phytovorans]|nr:hypothetical protein [Sphingomonas sp.]WEJ99264.1 MAG: hypothetical protein P0Y59_20370 [Sphingomonas sp.]
MVSAQANKFCGLLPKRNSFGSFFLPGPPSSSGRLDKDRGNRWRPMTSARPFALHRSDIPTWLETKGARPSGALGIVRAIYHRKARNCVDWWPVAVPYNRQFEHGLAATGAPGVRSRNVVAQQASEGDSVDQRQSTLTTHRHAMRQMRREK